MTDPRVIHRFIPPSVKSGARTACGIHLVQAPITAPGTDVIEGVDQHGSYLRIATKGQSFDCKRCTQVIESYRKGRISA